jgi:hypothetical protein
VRHGSASVCDLTGLSSTRRVECVSLFEIDFFSGKETLLKKARRPRLWLGAGGFLVRFGSRFGVQRKVAKCNNISLNMMCEFSQEVKNALRVEERFSYH